MEFHFEDFTEDSYRGLLRLAKQHWRFSKFCDTTGDDPIALWRHDIDLSVHRSLRLAQIEAEEHVAATYFIHLHNTFYHPLEKSICDKLKQIQSLGHELALHFEPDFYGLKFGDFDQLEKALANEKRIIESIFGSEVRVFSFHNPDLGGWHELDTNEIAGMLSTYGRRFRSTFDYCSDSNGYWRHQRLHDFLEQNIGKNIQVLTHPVWWTPEVLSPRERIGRCIDGRANAAHLEYDAFIDRAQRVNVR